MSQLKTFLSLAFLGAFLLGVATVGTAEGLHHPALAGLLDEKKDPTVSAESSALSKRRASRFTPSKRRPEASPLSFVSQRVLSCTSAFFSGCAPQGPTTVASRATALYQLLRVYRC